MYLFVGLFQSPETDWTARLRRPTDADSRSASFVKLFCDICICIYIYTYIYIYIYVYTYIYIYIYTHMHIHTHKNNDVNDGADNTIIARTDALERAPRESL